MTMNGRYAPQSYDMAITSKGQGEGPMGKLSMKMSVAAKLAFAMSGGELEIDGEMHGDAALDEEIRLGAFPNSRLRGQANLLVMPTLDAANISFNLLKVAAGDNLTVGPILLGAAKPVNILTPTATVRRIVNMTALTVVDAG